MPTFYHIKFCPLEEIKTFPMAEYLNALLTAFLALCLGSDWDQDRTVWRMVIPPDEGFNGFDFYLLSTLA